MIHCPVCNASVEGRDECRRCRLDLVPLRAVEREAHRLRRQARVAALAGDAGRMLRHAERAHFLQRTSESRKLLAWARLLNRDFEGALSVWSGEGRHRQGPSSRESITDISPSPSGIPAGN